MADDALYRGCAHAAADKLPSDRRNDADWLGGDRIWLAGDWQQAESLLRDIISEHPDFAKAHSDLGSTLGMQGRLQESPT